MIECRAVGHAYGSQVAIHDLSFTIERGEAFGFIGPNGAGKSTTIKILTGLLRPTSGEAYVRGFSTVEEPEKVRQIIGYMPERFGVYDGLRVREYLDYFAALHKIPASRRGSVIDGVMDLTDLSSLADRFTEHLSKGMRQRLCLAKTLLHDPEVLVLDEPASGLDPRARLELRELLKELRRMGKTLFVSSHILPELSGFCTQVGILEGGRLKAFGPLESVIQQGSSAETHTLRLLQAPEGAAPFLSSLPELSGLVVESDRLRFELKGGPAARARLLKSLVLEGYEPTELVVEAPALETAFLRLTEGVVA